jgi:molybdenum cofactor cytidylyltransferase
MSAVQSFAVVPAAGHSRRMGRDKLKLDWASNQTVLGATLQGWLASRVDHVIVVTRHDQGDLRERHGGLPRVAFLAADPPPPEMKDSVLVALRYIADQFAPAPADVWLLAPADMPRLPSQVVNDLLAAHDVAAPRILKPTLQGKHGHPVLFPWPLAAHVAQLPDDQGINALSGLSAGRDLPCCDPAIFQDLDTPRDYRRQRHT